MLEINKIYNGDCARLIEQIDDESVDLIMCDPVYWIIEQYAWLADVAARVLKPGGSIVAQTGSEYRFAAESAMIRDYLEHRPLLVETYSGGFMQMWKHRSLNGYHGYVWMTKGARAQGAPWVHTWVRGSKDKSRHVWGDGTTAYRRWIPALCPPDGLVLDPFTGGGTVPSVCKMLGRKFIAFEVVEEIANRAIARLAETPAPLFIYDDLWNPPVQQEFSYG